jgi:hypothetical protein
MLQVPQILPGSVVFLAYPSIVSQRLSLSPAAMAPSAFSILPRSWAPPGSPAFCGNVRCVGTRIVVVMVSIVGVLILSFGVYFLYTHYIKRRSAVNSYHARFADSDEKGLMAESPSHSMTVTRAPLPVAIAARRQENAAPMQINAKAAQLLGEKFEGSQGSPRWSSDQDEKHGAAHFDSTIANLKIDHNTSRTSVITPPPVVLQKQKMRNPFRSSLVVFNKTPALPKIVRNSIASLKASRRGVEADELSISPVRPDTAPAKLIRPSMDGLRQTPLPRPTTTFASPPAPQLSKARNSLTLKTTSDVVASTPITISSFPVPPIPASNEEAVDALTPLPSHKAFRPAESNPYSGASPMVFGPMATPKSVSRWDASPIIPQSDPARNGWRR